MKTVKVNDERYEDTAEMVVLAEEGGWYLLYDELTDVPGTAVVVADFDITMFNEDHSVKENVAQARMRGNFADCFDNWVDIVRNAIVENGLPALQNATLDRLKTQ